MHEEQEDELAPSRGIINGLILGATLWFVIIKVAISFI